MIGSRSSRKPAHLPACENPSRKGAAGPEELGPAAANPVGEGEAGYAFWFSASLVDHHIFARPDSFFPGLAALGMNLRRPREGSCKNKLSVYQWEGRAGSNGSDWAQLLRTARRATETKFSTARERSLRLCARQISDRGASPSIER